MPYIEVDVHLDDFELEDIADHLIDRLSGYKKNKLLPQQNKRFISILEDLNKEFDLNQEEEPLFRVQTITDELKVKTLLELYNKYTLEQIEQLKL